MTREDLQSKSVVRFEFIKTYKEGDCGRCFTRYNPETGEGFGWVGTVDGSCMISMFKQRLWYGELMYQEHGFGQGCFWSDMYRV